MRVFWRAEMWCRRQAAAAILPLLLAGWLTGESSEALTTFGKSNTQAPRQQVSTPLPARRCSKQTDCKPGGTSCVRTHYDATLLCLCGDNTPPVNGQCEQKQQKSLYHLCANHDDCNDGLNCGVANITGPPPPHLLAVSPTDKICLCDQENGFREHEYACSDADIITTSMFAVLFVSCVRKLLIS